MAQMLIKNIQGLVNARKQSHLLRGKDLAELPVINNAFLLITDGIIEDFGSLNDMPAAYGKISSIDASGQFVLPSWCDSHTHLVFAATREEEFLYKIQGMSYAEIASKGGGILNSARKLNKMSEDELYIKAKSRLEELIQLGTGAIEIKSGYGLTLEGELKMLRVIRRLKSSSSIPIKATFLGAHAFPESFANDREAYIDLLINEMLPVIAQEKLADFIDVFCERGFFSNEETERILRAGKHFGLKAKIHANQLSSTGAVQTATTMGALSADHLECMDEDAIQSLATATTIGTLLPAAAFFLRLGYPPARKLIDQGAAIALASDLNPGSCPSGNMNFVIALACIQMGMMPSEAINAATLNGAYAMELGDEVGSITPGKRANIIFTRPIDNLNLFPYSFGSNLIEKVMISGEVN